MSVDGYYRRSVRAIWRLQQCRHSQDELLRVIIRRIHSAAGTDDLLLFTHRLRIAFQGNDYRMLHETQAKFLKTISHKGTCDLGLHYKVSKKSEVFIAGVNLLQSAVRSEPATNCRDLFCIVLH